MAGFSSGSRFSRGRFGRNGGPSGSISTPAVSVGLTGSHTLSELAEIGDVIGTLSVSNLAGGVTVSSYAITADPDSKFVIAGTSLNLNAALDYEVATSHSVTVQATLSSAATVSKIFIITITDFVPAVSGSFTYPYLGF